MSFDQQIAVKPSVSTTDEKRVEVSVEGDKAVIRMSTYADGIGWFVQKTITVDADLLDALAEQFAIVRGKIHRESDDILFAEVLEF